MQRMPERIDSRFRFILLAAERAEQMMRGASSKVDHGDSTLIRAAMEEISNDLVGWDYGPEPEVVPEIDAEETSPETGE